MMITLELARARVKDAAKAATSPANLHREAARRAGTHTRRRRDRG